MTPGCPAPSMQPGVTVWGSPELRLQASHPSTPCNLAASSLSYILIFPGFRASRGKGEEVGTSAVK